MAEADGRVVYEIVGDNKKAIESVKEVTQTVEREGKKWDQATEKSSDNIRKSFSKAFDLERIKNWAIDGAKEVVKFAKECVNAFSDLEEVQNVVDVTFGEAGAAKIERWAKQAATSFGLTETQAKKFTSTLGAMMKSAGMTGDEIVDVSTDLAGLAADMASFYNLDFDTAFQKIRSGISGETEPLKQLGINMSQANLQAFALAQGIKKPLDQMSQGEMIMLRYQYLMQATADAQGDFARTSDGYANSVRLLETNLESLKTKIGEVIIPIFAELVQGVNSFITAITQPLNRTVLDDFAEIESQTAEKLYNIQAQGNEVRQLVETLREVTDGMQIQFTDEMVDDLGRMGITSKQAEQYLKNLGFSTDEITTIQGRWLAVCDRLVQVIPGLTAVIDTETGALKEGTQSIEDWVSAWENGEERTAKMWAVEQKRAALHEQHANIGSEWLEMDQAEKRYFASLAQWVNWGGLETGFDTKGWSGKLHMSKESPVVNSDGSHTTFWTEWNNLQLLKREYEEKKRIYEDDFNALEQGERDLDQYIASLTKEEALALKGADAGKKFADSQRLVNESTEGATQALSDEQVALDNAMDALIKYADQVYQTVRSNLDNSAHAFDAIETPADKARQKVTDLKDELVNAKDKSNIQIKIAGAEAEIPTALSMLNNLTDQLAFLEEYGEKLTFLQSQGLSDELAAMLSDGSLESMDYIRALYENPEMIPDINQKYAQVTTAKNNLAQTLANNQLAVDSQFKTLTDAVNDALGNLADSGKTAYDNAAGVVNNIAAGINDMAPSVLAAVNQIQSYLAQLSGYSFFGFDNMNFSSMGSSFTPIAVDAPTRPGGFNYETMGQANGDHVVANGNVYLDGRKVGAVVNANNTQEYNNLNRSGVQYGGT